MNKIKQHKHSRNVSLGITKTLNTISFLKLPFNTSCKFHIFKTTNFSKNKFSLKQIINLNLQKHNINKTQLGIIKINDLIDSKNCNLVAIFKDYLISDYIDEFLRRFYKKKESKNRIPKFSDYYKNYLLFFCKPTFSDFFANEIIQSYGEAKAEIYYNKNYRNKNKEKKKINKEIAKTIFNTLIKESIEYVIKDTNEYINTISSQQTINLPDDTILNINGQNNKESINNNINENSISSILRCFSVENTKMKNNKNQNFNIKKLRKYDINNNSNKQIINSIQKEINNIQIKELVNKSHINKFKPTSTIPTSSRIYSGNKVNLKYNYNKNLKMTNIETSTSHNNLSSNRNKNKSKSKSKDFSNSKVINTQMSSSNFSRNILKSPLNSPTAKNMNNKIFLTSNSPKLNNYNNNLKKKSPGKNNNSKQGKNNLQLNKNTEHLNLKDIMKLTLQIYNDKTKNHSSKNNNNNNNNNNLNNNNNNNIINNNNNNNTNSTSNQIINSNFIRHQHTRSSPTINNFNININNHILLQNSNSNNNNIHSSKNSTNKISPLKNNSPNNKNNKERTFIRVNTDSQKRLNPYSPMSNYRNFASNTNKEIDTLLNNNFFSSFNGKNEKRKKENKGFQTIRQIHHSPLQSRSSLNHIYNDNLQKSHILSPQFTKNKGFFNNKKLKNHLNNYKFSNNIQKEKLNFPNENCKKENK